MTTPTSPSLSSRRLESPNETSYGNDPLKSPPDDDNVSPMDRHLLQPSRRVALQSQEDTLERRRTDWLRAYWLGLGLFLVLFAFWLLDTLKDPIFGALVNGSLDRHQPPAKLLSVCTTLFLVVCLEYLATQQQQQQQQEKQRAHDDVLDAGGQWSRMHLATATQSKDYNEWRVEEPNDDGRVSSRVFLYVCLPYCVFFGIMASLLQFNPRVALVDPSRDFNAISSADGDATYWHVVGYCLFAAIESFGSLSVATFWSYTNSTLSLNDAERFYGIIIALAQLGAILGSTMVVSHIWSSITLIVLACLIIVLHVIVMRLYSRRFPPTSMSSHRENVENNREHSTETTLWSGVHLILRHNYVLLILGTSCLYEVSLTCLNYQMTLLGWSRFEESDQKMSFKQFMGHYGQMVNASSLLLSSILFPWLIRRWGLRLTIRLFPTLLFIANVVAFGAMPGNLTVLFLSMSLLKAMTYSIHDPAKEILYIPTSDAIKFQSKFWIDVVGARIAKAIGSTINRLAGSVDRSIQVASAPSLLTAAALWWVCFRVGQQFDILVENETVVGADDNVCTVDTTTTTYLEEGAESPGQDDPEESTAAIELTNL